MIGGKDKCNVTSSQVFSSFFCTEHIPRATVEGRSGWKRKKEEVCQPFIWCTVLTNIFWCKRYLIVQKQLYILLLMFYFAISQTSLVAVRILVQLLICNFQPTSCMIFGYIHNLVKSLLLYLDTYGIYGYMVIFQVWVISSGPGTTGHCAGANQPGFSIECGVL